MSDREIYFQEAERFVAGTVGEPGERAFYLQVRGNRRLLTMSIEKSQVAALAQRVAILIREIRISQPLIAISLQPIDNAPLEAPIDEEFVVGEIGISFDDQKSVIEIELVELTENDAEDPVVVTVALTLGQADSFAKRSNSLVAAGRVACPFCGGPVNKSGHLCPRANGYRR